MFAKLRRNFFLSFFLTGVCVGISFGQSAKQPVASSAVAPSSPPSLSLNPGQQSPKPGEPVTLEGRSFITADGVHLSITYYPGAAGKDSVPVVLLHGKNGSRSDFEPLIAELTKKGMAVLVPDLRGHGKSTTRTVAGYGNADSVPAPPLPPGSGAFLSDEPPARIPSAKISRPGNSGGPPIRTEIDYNVADFNERDFYDMAIYDVEVLRRWIAYENNREQLNANKLVLVGVDMGASVAALWAKHDWTSQGGQRPAKQVKSAILFSPDFADAKGLLTTKPVRENVRFMIVAGKNSTESLESAKQLRSEILDGKEDPDISIHGKCPLILCNTEKQGASLLRLETPNLATGIPLYIEKKITPQEKSTKWMKIK